jgi:hypothetical protein
MWIKQALSWAQQAEVTNNPVNYRYAQEIKDSLGSVQIRPWYTPEELALMFPAIVGQLHGQRKVKSSAAGQISKELRTAGIGYLRNSDDPRGFRWQGSIRQFLIVSDAEEWTHAISQQEFERLMGQFPKYGDGARYKKS